MTTSQPPERMDADSESAILDRPLSSYVTFDWETVAWIILFILAVVTRFYDLGVRAMSHDESLHTLYSYYLYDAGNYDHNPMMHGPLLFHVNALIYALFGVTDATARIGPALAGLGVVYMTRLFRRYIGRSGALLAGLMIVISPTLLFHSRYIRNDIYIALFTLIWIFGAFRYLDTRRRGWLTVMILGMAFGFVTKENHFMLGAIVGAFFAGLALWQVIGTRFAYSAAAFLLGGISSAFLHSLDMDMWAFVAIGVGVLVAAALVIIYMDRAKWRTLRRNTCADLAILMLTLVMPFTAPFGHKALGWDAMAYATNTDLMRSTFLVLLVTVLAAGIAFFWFALRPSEEGEEPPADFVTFGTWAQSMGIFWLIQLLFFTTFLTNARDGFASGVVGSLGYWLDQQEVARGGQPWYYYFMLSGLYEFLPLILSIVGIAVVIYHLARTLAWDPIPVGEQMASSANSAEPALLERLRENRLIFMVFAIWWILASWAAYTIAGEKMPWLMTHMSLPMCIFGGWYLGRLIHRIDWSAARRTHALWLIGIVPALIFVLSILIGGFPSIGRTMGAAAGLLQWVLALGVAALLIYLTWRWWRAVGYWSAVRLLSLGFVALLFLLTVRFSYMLNYINFDLATEYLVYAHASPDVKRALSEIDLISERTVGERNIVVAYDDDSSWPLSWYMRDYPNNRFYGSNPTSDVMSAPVIIVGPKNYEKVHPYVTRDYIKRTYRLVWWPDQGYFNMTWERLASFLSDPDKWENIFQIAFYRRYQDELMPGQQRDLTQWPNRHDFEMWVRRDIAADIWDLSVAPVATGANSISQALDKEIDLSAVAIYEGIYGGQALLTPRALDVGPDGIRVIADTGNNRIVVLDRSGNELHTFGGFCNLAEGEASGCVDPDGSGPLALGDGQFNEPWGVSVDPQGNVYVADTWNGRIQVFDADGNFVTKWGQFNVTNGELGDPYFLFGPRGVAIDLEGNLLVADTGNKRILRYAPDGRLIQQVGGGGVIPGRFEEPTDVAVDPNDGSVFVADAWNRRIQKLDTNLSFVAEWAVPSWENQDRFSKPYLAVAADGSVYASDPAMYRMFVYTAAGEIGATFGNYGTEANRFGLPNGVATDLAGASVLVADADNNRVMVFPLVQ